MIKSKPDCKKQFQGTRLGKKYDIFHFDYVLKIKEDNGVLLDNITKTTVELEEKEATVAVSKQKVKEVSAAIVASDTVDEEDSYQLEIVNTQLRENRAEKQQYLVNYCATKPSGPIRRVGNMTRTTSIGREALQKRKGAKNGTTTMSGMRLASDSS